MYFTSGGDRAFESLMQGKPGFEHYDSGDAGAPEDCGDCRFYRPDWKYQFCVYAECPYQPGKLTAYDAVLFQLKGVDDEMAVFRVEKNRGYTVMSNHHLRNKDLSLKAKGLLSQMLSLPENWDYTLKGLSLINRESIDAIRTAVWELEKAGYITRQQNRDGKPASTLTRCCPIWKAVLKQWTLGHCWACGSRPLLWGCQLFVGHFIRQRPLQAAVACTLQRCGHGVASTVQTGRNLSFVEPQAVQPENLTVIGHNG